MRRVLLIGITLLALVLAVPAVVFGASGQGLPGLDVLGSGFSQDAEPPAEGSEPRPWIGAMLAPVSSRLAERLGLGEEANGLVVVRVKDDSPAAEAGLHRGDLVVQIHGVDVERPRDATEIVRESSPGDTLTFSVQRFDGEVVVEMDIDVVVGERPQRGDRPSPRWSSPLLPIAMALAPGLQHAEITVLDADGNPVELSLVAGTVSGAVDEGVLTVSPSDGSEDSSLTLDEDTRIFGKGGKVSAEELEDGDEVIVAMRDGELVAVLVTPLGWSKGKQGRRHGRGSHFTSVVGEGAEVTPSSRLGRPGFRGGAHLRGPELRGLGRSRGPQVQERSRGRERGGEGALRRGERSERMFQKRYQLLEELRGRLGSRLDDLLGRDGASEEQSNDAPAANPSNSDLVV